MTTSIPYKILRPVALIFSCLAIVLSSCSKDDAEIAYESQEKKINDFVEKLLKDDETGITVSYHNGSTILTLISGEGAEVTKNSTITFDYIAYIFNGNLSNNSIVATSDVETAKSAGLGMSDPSIYAPVTANLKDGDLIQGLQDGLIGAKEGEQRLILFSGKYGFGKKKLGMISANTALAYQVIIREVKN